MEERFEMDMIIGAGNDLSKDEYCQVGEICMIDILLIHSINRSESPKSFYFL
jgi:hypothetical protein